MRGKTRGKAKGKATGKAKEKPGEKPGKKPREKTGQKMTKEKTYLPFRSHSASSPSLLSLSSVRRSVVASVSVGPRPVRSSRRHRTRVSRSLRCP